MLVIVHHGDVEGLLEALLDVEALRGLDILEVDTTKGGSDALYCLAELLGILLGYLDIEYVDTTVDLEEQTFTLHDGLAAHGADVAQTEYGSTVRDNGYQVTLIGVLVSCVGVLLNLQTGIGHAGRIGETQVGLCTISLGGLYFNFSRASALVVFEGRFFRDLYHNFCVLLIIFLPLLMKIWLQKYKKVFKNICVFSFFYTFVAQNV